MTCSVKREEREVGGSPGNWGVGGVTGLGSAYAKGAHRDCQQSTALGHGGWGGGKRTAALRVGSWAWGSLGVGSQGVESH